MYKKLNLIYLAMLTSLVFSNTHLINAQEVPVLFSVKGRVKGQQEQPLPYANVFIEALGIGAVSDERGVYTLEKVPNGTHSVIVKVLGFTSESRTVVVQGKNKTGIDFRLQEQVQGLSEVVVQSKGEAEWLQESAQAISVVQTQVAKLQNADLGEVMAKTEGVSVQRAGGLGSGVRFALNGLSGDKIRFFYNGIPLQYTPYAFGIANVPVNLVDRLEVYKGVVPIRLGADALGGAVNLVSPPINEELGLSLSYQTGSFGTHRGTAQFEHWNADAGFFVAAGGFYDYTGNDYKIDVAIPDEQGQLRAAKVKRFHDGYRAFGANFLLGIRDKKWAGELSVEMYYGDYHNEVQNSQYPGLVNQPSFGISNAVASNPFGEVRFTSLSGGTNLHYNIRFSNKWEFNLKTGYNYNERQSIDTGNCLYDWFGNCIRTNNEAGEFGEADNLITQSEGIFARPQLSYAISGNNTLRLVIAPTYSFRTGDDLLVDDEFDPALDNNYLFDFVTGLEHRIKLFDGRLANTAFVKNYRQNIRIESLDPSIEGTLVDKRSASNLGAGNGFRYEWSPRFSTKLSYEYAIRLPRQDEFFGDGQLTLENPELRPENSHNLNFQWRFSNTSDATAKWRINGNFFWRQIDDLIFLLVEQNDLGSYQNVWSATSKGFELSGRWGGLVKGLALSANTTYQNYVNTSKTGPFSRFKGDRIPNRPYFFINAAATYQSQDVLKKNDDLSFFWNSRFVQSFFIGWESAGLRETKLEVPGQAMHTAGLTHRMEFNNIQTAITLEVQNLTNAKVFDFFGVQRPGRSVFIKLTTQL